MRQKFKVGDTAYSVRHGFQEIVRIDYSEDYPIVTSKGFIFTADGKALQPSKKSSLLTLEEARAKGYDVPKIKVKKEAYVWALFLGKELIDVSMDPFTKPPAGYTPGVVTLQYEVEE